MNHNRSYFHRAQDWKIADKGYQGIAKIHNLSETPIKKPRGKKLTKKQKKYNRELKGLQSRFKRLCNEGLRKAVSQKMRDYDQ